jgi:hypothetical protein
MIRKDKISSRRKLSALIAAGAIAIGAAATASSA